jgi:hypothetical protein
MRFRKSIKIASGIKINLSKSGISSTIGGKGLSVNVGAKGAYLNTGIPGTGINDRAKLTGSTNGEPTADIEYIQDGEYPESEKPLELQDWNEYKDFKKKIKNANGKVNFASDLSYYELFHTIPENAPITTATQYCGKSSLGAIVTTDIDFYAVNKKDNQKIILPLNTIKSISITGGFFKTDILIKTDSDDYVLKSIVRLKETIDFLSKTIVTTN